MLADTRARRRPEAPRRADQRQPPGRIAQRHQRRQHGVHPRDIDRLQPTSVTDLLTRVPGVQVAPTGGRGSLPGIYIRGTKAAQSLVLVDGVRIANATSGDSGLQFLDVDQIERMEVLRGSRSAMYGSDAIGGVIQIFTRRGDGKACSRACAWLRQQPDLGAQPGPVRRRRCDPLQPGRQPG
jgi:outer membrane cobalamin receptor